jgi:hypothetical protein
MGKEKATVKQMEALYDIATHRGEFLPSVGVEILTDDALALEELGLLEIHDEYGDQPPVSVTKDGMEILLPVIKAMSKLRRALQ